MSNETITLNANKRDVLGKKVRALRAEGKTPAVIHDHGKNSIHISIEEKELKKVYIAAGRHHPVDLNVEGKKYTTLIKEVTNKPATGILYHSVFQAIKANETVKAEIPVKLTEEIPAERASLLVLQSLETVEVEALPADLVDSLEVNADKLVEPGDKLQVSDIVVPKNVTILSDPETVIATVEIPKNQTAEADAAAADLAADAGSTATGGDADSADGGEASDVDATDEKQD